MKTSHRGERRRRFAPREREDAKKTRTRIRDGSSWELAGVDRDRTDASRVWPVGASGPWFHGGVPDLTLGDLILPPTVTGARSIAAIVSEAGLPIVGGQVRDDVVFFHRDPDQAAVFAAFARPRGSVYQVEPAGEIYPDPDWKGDPGASGFAKYATIVRVVARDVTVG